MRKLLTVLGLATVLLGGGLAAVSPASAASGDATVLCKGFSSCAKKGRSTGGYSSVYKSSYWGQTAGHNCTNYVAYRLTHNGHITAKPPGIGNASTWAAAADLDSETPWLTTTTKPKVGDIAWWGANQGPATSTGHVAFVQSVSSTGKSVVVSEDNLHGDFQWVQYKGDDLPQKYLRFPASDGSPRGYAVAVVSGGKLTATGYATDPDAYSKGLKYHVVVTQPGKSTVSFTTSQIKGQSFSFWSTLTGYTSAATVKVYGVNNPGTKGKQALLEDVKP